MATESTVVYTPDNNNGGSVPAWLAMQNGGWGNGLGGWGGGILGFILGALFGNGGFGNGFGFGGGGSAAASLGAQATANSNTDLILNAINGTDADVRLLASTLNSDIDSVRLAINTVQGAIQTVGAQLGLTGQQIINSIQSGNASLASQLCQCCCENKLLVTSQGYENQIATLNQTNALNGSINANGQKTVDAIADLKTTMVQEFCTVKEREMQSKIDTQADIIGQLRNAADNANQTNQIIGYVNSVVTPLATKVNEIASKQLPTVPVIYPNIQAVNNTPFGGAMYPGYGYGYGVPGGSYWG